MVYQAGLFPADNLIDQLQSLNFSQAGHLMNLVIDQTPVPTEATYAHCIKCNRVFKSDPSQPSASICPDCTSSAPKIASGKRPRPSANPVRLGGWLLLIGLGMIVGLFASLAAAYGAITTGQPGVAALHIFDSVTYSTLLALFFMKHRWFPIVFIGYAALSLLIITLVFFTASAPNYNAVDLAQIRLEFFRTIVSCAIWIPYMLRSHRVLNTFY